MIFKLKHPCAGLRKGVTFGSLLFVLFMPGILSAQTRVDGEIIGGQGLDILLAEHFGDNSKVIDTIVPDETGRFVYSLDSLMPAGLYRLYFPDDSFLEFIFGFEDVRFQTIAAAPEQGLIIYESPQNESLYDFYSVLDKNAPAKAVLKILFNPILKKIKH